MATKLEIDLPSHPVRYVVVYPDRAEVTREITVSLQSTGEQEIQLKNISKALDKDSVRVDGVGSASITEVSFQEIPVTKKEDEQTEIKEKVSKLNEELADVENKLSSLLKKKERLNYEQNLLETYSTNLISYSERSNTVQLISEDTIESVFAFMDSYGKETLDLQKQLYAIENEKNSFQKRKNEINKCLNELTPNLNKQDNVIMQTVIGILLSVKEKGEIKLLVSYVVSNASWSPKYDLRVSSKDRTMSVNYFGMVQQNTGEEWVNTKLSLSTAVPSVGGSPPTLDTLCLNLIEIVPQKKRGSKYGGIMYEGDFELDANFIRDSNSSLSGGVPPLTSEVSKGLTSSIFDIIAPATVNSDNSAHKVSIATIQLKPTFEYETVPKLSQNAFLKAKVKNDSEYPLLSGPANVFLDNSFVTRSCLNNVSPQEEFSCSLGVDPSVRVVYKPIQRYREESGVLSVSVIFNFKQITEITNTRNEPAVVHMKDNIPLSRDDKLKVVLLEPVIGKVKSGEQLPNPNITADNHINWTLELASGETKAVVMRYYVEHPKKKEIEGL